MMKKASVSIKADKTQFGGTLTLTSDAGIIAVMDYHRDDNCLELQPIRIKGEASWDEVFPFMIRKLYKVEAKELEHKNLSTRISYQNPSTINERGNVYIENGVRVVQLPEKDNDADEERRKRLKEESIRKRLTSIGGF